MVRCLSCGAQQSEWAAQCAGCGADLADAATVAPTPRSARRVIGGLSVVGVAAVALAVVALAGVGVVLVVGGGQGRRNEPRADVTPTASEAPTPSGPVLPLVVWSVEPSGDLVRHPPGKPQVDASSVAGWPEGPALAGGQVFYLSGGVVHELGRPDLSLYPLVHGPIVADADRLIGVWRANGTVGPGQIWVDSRVGDPGVAEADLWTQNGAQWQPTATLHLPPDEVPVAAVPDRLVIVDVTTGTVIERDAGSGHVVRRVGGLAGDGGAMTSAVIGATDRFVTFVACADSSDCPIATSSPTGTRFVHPPAGTSRFIGGGAVSPAGSIAAFALGVGAGANEARVVLIDPTSGAARVVPYLIAIGDPVGAATWAPNGEWLVFGGPRETEALDVKTGEVTRLPYAAGYGFIASLCC